VKRAKASDGFDAFVADQLSDLDALVMKRMFGGTGLYLDGVFFGLIYSDRLYFRVSDETIDEYKQRKMKPFKPFEGKKSSRRYYEVPLEILESPLDLARWARKASKA
jgi:DNA transformation protein